MSVRTSAEGDAVLLVEAQDRVSVLTLNRPRARNSLSLELIASLHAALDRAGSDPTISAVVLAAAPPAFSAGHDLAELQAHRTDADGGRAFYAETMRACAALMQAVVACPVPVVAAVEGMATAAGCQLVAASDLALASEAARFATPGVNIGLFCSTPMVALTRNVPRKRAMEMLLLGEALSAREAADYGLVNRVVPQGQALAEALSVARRIAQRPRATIALGKQAFYRQIEAPLAEAYDLAACVMVDNMMRSEAVEGIGAFLDKREPDWNR